MISHMFEDTLMRLTQLGVISLELLDFSGLEKLPPNVMFLSLQTWKVLDMAATPCLQSCSSLQSLSLRANKAVPSHAIAAAQLSAPEQVHLTRGLCAL